MRDRTHHEPKEMFIFQKVLWRPHKVEDTTRGMAYWQIQGPYCAKCRTPLKTRLRLGTCPNPACGQQYDFGDREVSQLLELAHQVFDGEQNRELVVYSLDLPPGKVKEENEDENYWVEARMGQKDGKKMAIVFFGEKKKTQSKKDYSQLFIDFDDEQIRFDKANQNPLQIITKLEIDFDSSKITVDKD